MLPPLKILQHAKGCITMSTFMKTVAPLLDMFFNNLSSIAIIFAGPPRNGKSTGVNIIFGLDPPARLSARTQKFVSIRLETNGISLTVTATSDHS